MTAKDAVSMLVNESINDPKLEGPVHLGVKFKDPALTKPKYLPTLISLPHKTRRTDETSCCFVVADPSIVVAEALAQSKVTQGLFDEVIGIKKLRRRIKTRKAGHSAKGIDQFTRTFTHIFVQNSVHRELIELLGREYYKRPRQIPIGISLEGPFDSEETLLELKHIVRSTTRQSQLVLKPESLYASMRIGHTKMGTEKLLQNVSAAVERIRMKVPNGNTADFEIKTSTSLALPL